MDFSFGTRIYSSADPTFQSALEAAYQRRTHPLCLCIEKGVEMYISKCRDRYVLKRMPGTGFEHAADCQSFEVPPEISGRGEVDGRAIVEDANTGNTNLKFEFSLLKSAKALAPKLGEGTADGIIQSSPSKLSIIALFHLLYEDAQLNRYNPTSSRRAWPHVQSQLAAALQSKVAKKSALGDLVVIPKPFQKGMEDKLFAERAAHFAKFKAKGQNFPVGILLGELKTIEPTRYGYRLLVKHMPEQAVYMEVETFNTMKKRYAHELSIYDQDEEIHLMVVASFILTPSGNPQIDTVALISLDRNWIPFESIAERRLLAQLVAEKRHFIKCLRYNLPKNIPSASFLLTDIPGNPTAIFIRPEEPDDDYESRLAQAETNSKLTTTTWDPLNPEPFVLPGTRQEVFRDQPTPTIEQPILGLPHLMESEQ